MPSPYCRQHGLSVLAYSLLAQGLLTGKFGPEHQFEPGDHRAQNKLFQGDHFQRALKAVGELRPIAERHGCTLTQLALAWLIAQPNVHAITGARNAEQAQANAQAAQVQLSPAELDEVDAIGWQVSDRLEDTPIMWDFAA